jgi:hypothetical protein
MKMLILKLCAGLMAMAPIAISACECCDKVDRLYMHIMRAQYYLSNDLYEEGDAERKAYILDKIRLLDEVKKFLE